MGEARRWRETAEVLSAPGPSGRFDARLLRWLAQVTLGVAAPLERAPVAVADAAADQLRLMLVDALERRILDSDRRIDIARVDQVLIDAFPDVGVNPDRYISAAADWLSLELLHGEPARISRALAMSVSMSPFAECGEAHAPLQMLARADVPALGTRAQESMFWGAYFLMRVDPLQVVMRELANGNDPRHWRCWNVAAMLDRELVDLDGRNRAYVDRKPGWSVVRRPHGAEFRYGVRLHGAGDLSALTAASGMFFVNPWGPIDLLLDPGTHRKVCKGRGTHGLLANEQSRIMIAIEPAPGLVFGPGVIDAFRTWVAAGVPWLRARHPWFVGDIEVSSE